MPSPRSLLVALTVTATGLWLAASPAAASVTVSAPAVAYVSAPAVRTAASPAPLPPPPSCAADLAPFAGVRATPSPTPRPLPSPASTTGGARLALPGRQVAAPIGGSVPAPPAIRASAWLVADLTTGAVLASCNAHVPLAPASTLKVLTALALMHRVDPHALYRAGPQDAAIDGTKVGLVPGSVYTVGDLWHGLLMSSGNDCASALAQLAGGPAVAAAELTETARALGAADTVVANTSGLDAPGQVSSAYDLALFGRAALADPAITVFLRTRDYAFPAAGTALPATVGAKPSRKTYQIQNHDRLLYNYPGATGVKNGYTVAAGGSFVGSATRGGRSYIVTLLRADTNTWHAAAALLDWAFVAGRAGTATPVGTLDAAPVVTPTVSPGNASPGNVGSPAGAVAVARDGTGTRSGSAAPAETVQRITAGPVVASAAVFAVLAVGSIVLVRRRRRPGARSLAAAASSTASEPLS